MTDKTADDLAAKRARWISAGWKPTKASNPNFKCRQCQSDDILFDLLESSDGAYDDYHYHCFGCDRDWWVESSDY